MPARDPSLTRAARRVRTSPMFAVLEVLGDPWVLRLLHETARGRGRFEALVESLALPRSTLAARLRALVDAGCLCAEAYSTSPPRFDYRLTAKGEDALGGVLLLRQWTRRWAPRRVDDDEPAIVHRCGAPLVVEAVCGACGEGLDARAVTALEFPPPLPAPVVGDGDGDGHGESLPPVPDYRRTRRGHERLGRAARLSPTAEECVGDRWLSLVLGGLLLGLHRFRDFGFALDIAPNILSARLTQLAKAGLVERRASTAGSRRAGASARADYRLTEKGRALYPAIAALQAWGERWLDPGWAHRAGWSPLHRPCAAWLSPRVVCAACREPV